MSRLLLIETATQLCSVAIAEQGCILSACEEYLEGADAARLTLLVETCLEQAELRLRQIDGVAVSRGPGSYTGLRVGVSTAKGICYALDKPLLAVPTLQALAWGAQQKTPTDNGRHFLWVPMLDARRQEVWAAVFDDQLRPICPDQPLILDSNLLDTLRGWSASHPNTCWICAGNGAEKIPAALLEQSLVRSPVTACSAVFLAELAQQRYLNRIFENIAYFEPHYMKPPNITQPKRGRFFDP